MAVLQGRTFRLVPRGHAGLSCDDAGVALGAVGLATVNLSESGERRCEVRPLAELQAILGLAYGAQTDDAVRRCHRGLRRAAAAIEANDLARAGIEAVMLRLPDLTAEGLAKLAAVADLEKGGTSWQDQPRIPAGQPGGGEWTSDGGGAGAPPSRPSPAARPGPPGHPARAATASETHGEADESNEVTVTSPVTQSRTENGNGFYQNSRGGGVFYIPSVTNGQSIRPTEVHALDANRFQVSWTDSAITLRDRTDNDRLYATAVSPDDLKHFNATTGQILGVSIYTFPGQPLGHPDAPPTPEEERELANEAARLQAGRLASEQSWSGRITTGMVLVASGSAAATTLISLLPAAAETAPALELNRLATGIELARKLGVAGENLLGLPGPKVAIRVLGRLRIPDYIGDKFKILVEVKNVQYLKLTPQLRDFMAFCQKEGYDFQLYVRPSTRLSAALLKAIQRGKYVIRYIPGTI